MSRSEDTQGRNVNLRRVSTTWTKDGQTIITEGLIGWDDKVFNFNQEMSRSSQEMLLSCNGWQRGDEVITAIPPEESNP